MNKCHNRFEASRAAMQALIYSISLSRRSYGPMVLALLALCLAVCGCKTTQQRAPVETQSRQTSHVDSTNAIPIEIEDDHVYVRGKINGREVRLVLDTGATHVVVSPQTAAAAGIRNGPEITFFAFGTDKGSANQAVADFISVGPAVSEHVPMAVMPLPSVFNADGLLGLSFLKEFSFRLDYQNKTLCFQAPGKMSIPNGATGFDSKSNEQLLTIPAELDGVPARLIVDTGAGQNLILHPWFVDKKKLRQSHPNRLSVVTGGGLLGLTRGEITRLRTLKLGDHTFDNVFVEFGAKNNSQASSIAGYIGGGLLRRFTLTFDAASRQMFFETNSSFGVNPPPPACVRSGFVCFPQGDNWTVIDLIPGSAAAEAGVLLGDRILEINGLSVSKLKLVDIKNAFKAEAGTRVQLRLQTGEEHPREAVVILRDLL